jgi:DNA-binding XRE family transcriptional regulator
MTYLQKGETTALTTATISPVFLVVNVQWLNITAKMVNNQDSNFNPNVPTLKQVRDRLGMTQEEFAKVLGISRGTVISYESGKHRKLQLSMAQMKKLFELMKQAGLPIDELPEDIE